VSAGRTLWLLARLRLKEMIHSPGSAALYLGFPTVLLVLIGLVFAGGHPFERRTVAVVDGDEQLVARLERFPELRVERDPDAVALAKLRARAVNALVLPGRIAVGPRDELFARGLAAALGDRRTVEKVEVPRWGYVHYLFPGLVALVIVAGGLLGMGYSMVRYRSNQFLKKLSTTPLGRATFVAAQIGSRTALVMGQLALLVAAAWLAFDLPLTASGALWLAALSALGLLTFMGAGFLVACAIRNEANLLDLINVLMMPIVFFSEVFFSVDVLPAPLAAVARALPSTQLVRLSRALLLYGDADPGALARGVAILGGWALVTYAVAVRAFRWYET
jgi:ABC-type multidrug transport system permease subunit